MLDVSHDLPNVEPSDPDLERRDRATSSGPGAPVAAAERDRTKAESPGRDALARLARLLGRQAAQEDMQAYGAGDGV